MNILNEETGFAIGNVVKEEQDVAAQKLVSQYTRSLIEASLDPLVTISGDGKITDVNEALIKVTGIARQKLIGTDFSNYFTEPKKAQAGYQQVFEKGFVADYALTIKHENGKLTDVLYNASVYKDDKGNVLGVFAAARDITSQKQASQYARSLIEASLDPLVTISADGKITDVNEASIKVTGIARQKLIGTDFSNYFTEPEKAQAGYQQVFEKGFVADYALTIKHENGKLTDVLYNASVYKDDKGNVLGVFAAARDITSQKQAELITANKDLAFQNQEKEKRATELGIANNELAFQNEEKEKRAAELGIANKELAFQNDEKEKRAAELGIANKELAFQNDEKEKRAAELGIANKELAFQNDEKEKRATELGIANKELAFQNDEKEKRAIELIAANKELQSFAYVSSHDLQEPLRKIQTFSNRILEKENENLSDTGKDYFLRIQNAAKRMQTLIEDLLAFSRVNTGEQKFENTDLKKIIEELSNDFKEKIEEKNAMIQSNQLGSANIIPFQFRQLMQNLMGNALKFSKPNVSPHIIISSNISKGSVLTKQNSRLVGGMLAAEKNYSHITVSDNGIGFEPKFQDQVFEVFQRLHGKEEYAGTGIGLAIVKKIVESHNGIITATSELDKGTVFDIYIPEN